MTNPPDKRGDVINLLEQALALADELGQVCTIRCNPGIVAVRLEAI